ncbi:MAG TPA: DUF2231 domain-containing protein [Gemmatimonadaceae bacterium]
MLPSPLHPAIVHFPVVLAFLLPLFVGGAFWTIRRGANLRRAWMLPVACAVALSLSAFAAVRTGSTQSDRVERIVSERVIESHEEMAEAFLAASAGVVLIALAGLIGGVTGKTARLLTGVGALTLAGLVVRVGHTGGQLVYRYGAGAAYTQTGGPTGATGGGSASGQLRGDHDAR